MDDVLQQTAKCLEVMAHPVGFYIMNILHQDESTVHEIATLVGKPPNQTCGHLQFLDACKGMLDGRYLGISQRREQSQIPCGQSLMNERVHGNV